MNCPICEKAGVVRSDVEAKILLYKYVCKECGKFAMKDDVLEMQATTLTTNERNRISKKMC